MSNITHTIEPKTTPKPKPNNMNIIIPCVAVAVLVVVIIAVFFCCRWRRRRRKQKEQTHRISIQRADLSVHSDLFDTGQINPGLHLSDQDITTTYPPLENRKDTTIICVPPPPYDDSPDQNGNINVSIRLLTPWNDIYNKSDSDEYTKMKKYIQSSVETIYTHYEGFEHATLKMFRPGSVIAEVQLKFSTKAVKPLLPLQRAVKSGKCEDLIVDRNFFQIHKPGQEIINGFPEELSHVQETPSANKNQSDHPNDALRPERESGYGSDKFADELQIKLHKHQKKNRDSSTKSTESRDSVTSEMGTSYSVSPKSLSSTNISIHSCADDEINQLENSGNRKKGFFSLPGRGKKHDPVKTKQPSGLVGDPHIALFDFQPQDYRELALRQGQLVRVTYIDNGGWVKAINEQNVQGWVPHNFVTPIDPEKYDNIKRSVEVVSLIDNVVDQEMDNMLHNLDQEGGESHYHVPRKASIERHQGINDTDRDTAQDSSDSSSDSNTGMFVTIFPFEPSEKNELKLEVGDVIDVLKIDETGWWKGCCLGTQEEGWFPSSYVKPCTHEMIIEEDKGTVSDSEIQRRRTYSLSKIDIKGEDGYSSDNGETRTKKSTTVEVAIKEERDHEKLLVSSNGVRLRDKKGPPKERAVSLIIDIDTGSGKVHFPAPLTPPPRLSAHRDHANNNLFDPPTKPVPPKPRSRHIEKTYRILAASGKLGSTDSLKTVSTECLVPLGRSSQHKSGSWKKRRNSEDTTLPDGQFKSKNGVPLRDPHLRPVIRNRPKSFQETHKNSFLYLANRYVNMKPAMSLPTLVGDQVKLSPDDERPFLDPIPRKAKSRSFRDEENNFKDCSLIFSKPVSSSMKDLSDPLDNRPYLDPIPRKSKKEASTKLSQSDTYGQPIHVTEENEKDHTITQTHITTEKSDKNDHASHSTNSIKEICNLEKPLPPEPSHIDSKPVVFPKPETSNSILSQLYLSTTNAPATRPPLISQKPTVPVRTTSKNFGAKKLIEEHRNRSSNLSGSARGSSNLSSNSRGSGNLPSSSRVPIVGGRLRTQIHFSSFESINEEVEQACTPKDETKKFPSDHDHRRSRSEPHEHILKSHKLNNVVSPETSDISINTSSNNGNRSNNIRSNSSSNNNSENQKNIESNGFTSLPSSSTHIVFPVSTRYDEKTEGLTYDSRASSLQSLNSIASSARSTASSKHEQANLRRAIMNVHGETAQDLSFKAGAILYELRPKNKSGLCFGILEDSTQGWYPAESVESFHEK